VGLVSYFCDYKGCLCNFRVFVFVRLCVRLVSARVMEYVTNEIGRYIGWIKINFSKVKNIIENKIIEKLKFRKKFTLDLFAPNE